MRETPLDLAADLHEQRLLLEQIMTAHPLAVDVTVERISVGGVPAAEIEIASLCTSSVILYLHGGAYTMGSAASAAGLASELARRASACAVSVEYRLAPEHPYPAALDDAVAAYRGLLDAGAPPSQIAVAGESAGGGLAVALLAALNDHGLPQPSSAVVFSPWADLTLSGATMISKASLDPSLTVDGLRRRATDYVGGASASDGLVSPVFADLHGLPPLLIQVGSHEILLSDAIALAAHAAEHDVAVALEVTPEVPHVFQSFAEMLEEGDTALGRAGDFLRSHLQLERTRRKDSRTPAGVC
ncbi:MAG TPA: alpha/beta hydrolase fold domain-containing protein [Solirubrobacteraceae bacterium]|nr:alpha/beta hydrolase fold domain-containing protein [Solirubrobacteraceae bacterium]